MAEKVEIIEIDAGNATRTLKDLKEEVKNLRKALDDCELGSDKFASTLEELTAAQTELKNATKTSNEALEGSYDALVAKMGDLKKAWKATADEAERANLGEQIATINDQLKEMDASIGNYQRNVGNYGSAFDNVTLKIEGGVARFEKFNKASQSVIGSFALVEGGLKAVGVESEEVNEVMDKLKGAMVITQGLNSVKEGVVAFNAMRTAIETSTVAQQVLNAVMAANPIGAVVAAVAALAAGVAILIKRMNDQKKAIDRVNRAMDSYNTKSEERIRQQELEIRLMEANEKSEDEILKRRLKHANDNEKEARDTLLKIQNEYNAANKKTQEKMKEQLDEATQNWKDAVAAIRDIQDDQKVYEAEQATENRNRLKQEAKDYADYLKEREKYYRRIEEEEWKAREAAEKARWEATRQRREQEKQQTIDDYQDLLKTLSDYQKSELELELQTIEEQAWKMQETLSKAHDEGLISFDEYLDKLAEVATMQGEKMDAAIAKFEDMQNPLPKLTDSTKNYMETLSLAAQMTANVFGQTAQLLNTFANAQNKEKEEGFEASKKLSIGAAIMSMLQGIIGAWTSAMSPSNAWMTLPGQIALGTAMTAATATLGGIQIDQIKKQTFQNADKGGSGSSTTMPSINTAALMSSPVNYTTEVQGARAQEDIVDTRVYVVESDITDTVNRVKVAEDESTF